MGKVFYIQEIGVNFLKFYEQLDGILLDFVQLLQSVLLLYSLIILGTWLISWNVTLFTISDMISMPVI